MILIILPIIVLPAINTATWEESAVTLPRVVDEVALGFFENEIYIIGGLSDRNQVIRYNIDYDNFTDYGRNVLSVDTWGTGQYYRQFGSILYLINNNRFSIYDLETKIFSPYWMNIDNKERACLTGTNEYLFVVGGYDVVSKASLTTVQTLTLSNTSWTISYMNEARRSVSCAASTNTLYAIGGYGVDFKDSIEMANISDMLTWTMLNDRLQTPVATSRSVSHEKINKIFVIGGEYTDNKLLDTVYIINTINHEVSLSSDRLPYGISSGGALRVNNIVYYIGGWSDFADEVDTWIYYIIPTDAPSHEPSKQPSLAPTNIPTLSPIKHPTDTPSNLPTLSPTRVPTHSPTSLPTTLPTDTPTNDPVITSIPTTSPTYIPTIVPGNEAEVVDITVTLQKTDEKDNPKQLGPPPGDWLIIILVISVVLTCCGIITIVVCWCNEYKQRDGVAIYRINQNINNNHGIQMQDQNKPYKIKNILNHFLQDLRLPSPQINEMINKETNKQTNTNNFTHTHGEDDRELDVEKKITVGQGLEGVGGVYNIKNDEFEVVEDDKATSAGK
eukprot:184065_1